MHTNDTIDARIKIQYCGMFLTALKTKYYGIISHTHAYRHRTTEGSVFFSMSKSQTSFINILMFNIILHSTRLRNVLHGISIKLLEEFVFFPSLLALAGLVDCYRGLSTSMDHNSMSISFAVGSRNSIHLPAQWKMDKFFFLLLCRLFMSKVLYQLND